MQRFDLHMHTKYCDGQDTAEAMVLSAIENGLSAAGISGHSFTPHDKTYCMSRAGMQKYTEEISALKQKYAGRIKLLLGIEMDRWSDIDTSLFDYRIGSVHYVFSEEGKRKHDAILSRHAGEEDRSAPDEEMETLVKYEDWCDVDDRPEDLVRFSERFDSMTDIAELYFDTVGGIVAATDCDIIGHFDLLTKFTEGWCFGPDGAVIKKQGSESETPEGNDIFCTSDERYIAAWKKAIDRIFDDCAARYKDGYRNRLEAQGILKAGDKPVFEINTGAISRGYRTVPYPSAEQIAYIKSKGGVLILSSDSHAAGTICFGFEDFAHLADN